MRDKYFKEISKAELNRLKNLYSYRFGENIDEWTVKILYSMDEGFDKFSEKVNDANELLKTAIGKIKIETNPVHFKSKSEAFWYGLGKNLIYGTTALLSVCLIGYFVTQTNEYNSKKVWLQQYKNLEHYKLLAQYGEIVSIGDKTYLKLYPPPSKRYGVIELGKNYERVSRDNTILVFLGKR